MLKAKLLGATAGAEAALAIEDVFSTYLYTGSTSATTITNNIDLSGEGGLVWMKSRAAASHHLVDTERGAGYALFSDQDYGNIQDSGYITAFSSNGFTIGANESGINQNGISYASWTFRQAPRFFDVVTYTGNGANRTIAHDLGVVPGCIIVKRTNTTGNWQVYHRSNTAAPETDYLVLNSTAATVDDNTRWNDTLPTSTVFSLGTNATVNASGGTYVAYLFAHDPLGPSGDGSDGLIACGSYTGNGSTNNITLGWEPQWVLIKSSTQSDPTYSQWTILDAMRGIPSSGTSSARSLWPNSSGAEDSGYNSLRPTATGFQLVGGNQPENLSGQTYIYIAIRRGPMREPTVGTEVFGLSARTGTGANATVTGGQTADAFLVKNRGSAVADLISSRMTGTGYVVTSSTAAEVAAGTTILQANPWDVMDGVKVGTTSTITNASSNTFINYLLRRAPGFFDVVAYTGTGVARTINHNLGVAPELIITKSRSGTTPWNTYVSSLGADKYLTVNTQNAVATNTGYWNNTSPTSSVFSVGASTQTNNSGATYISYLFASLPGISKVGSYTGNGSNQTINCGFTTGARFILIKRTDSTGYWLVWDTARGIVSGNDPFLALDLTNAEFTGYDIVDPDSSGFVINQEASFNMNVNAASYIYLAIA